MKKDIILIDDNEVEVYSVNTVIVGSGAAGFNVADRLYSEGQKDIVVVTENIMLGTSRNTGSDKQTYYKLTLSGGIPDSVSEMAETLFEGGCVDGDIALCEAALSTESFFNLVHLGVPFPKSRYGEYVGYKTDHDPKRRATGVGPYTSKVMTEKLETSVKKNGIRIFDKLQVIKLLVKNGVAYGVICLNLNNDAKTHGRFVCFSCKNIVYATGGPGGIYAQSVYPYGHYGSSGIAFEAGVKGKNLTEWQYGLASLRPRWNVSGSYMQVLPRFVSTDQSGNDEREFLEDCFNDRHEMLSRVFLKGYQWPFDVRKISDGSSIIDAIVFVECSKGRRVFLDFCNNSKLEDINFEMLSAESKDYLLAADSCFGTPYERLERLNMPAVEFYKEKGIDLSKEMLEIALCAQHNNGGLSTDMWWQTNIKGIFAVGEVAATHGVYRPGGSALNAGQVGGIRIAQYIANQTQKEITVNSDDMVNAFSTLLKTINNFKYTKTGNVGELIAEYTQIMSRVGGAIRNYELIEDASIRVKLLIDNFESVVKLRNEKEIPLAFRLRDILISQYTYLCSMKDYILHGGKSRGSSLYTDLLGELPHEKLPDYFRCVIDEKYCDIVQEVEYRDIGCTFSRRNVRPIPTEDDFFENVWKGYRENKNIY